MYLCRGVDKGLLSRVAYTLGLSFVHACFGVLRTCDCKRPFFMTSYSYVSSIGSTSTLDYKESHFLFLSREPDVHAGQIPLGSSRHVSPRHDTARSTCRARRDERFEPRCSTSSTRPKCMGSTRRTCRVVSRRDVTTQV